MPGFVVNGQEIEVPGIAVRNFKDDPKIALRVGRTDGSNDGKRRTTTVSMVVIHTTKGIPGGKDKRPQVILPGVGPDTKAEDRTASYWSTDPTPSGAHIVIDHDCSVGCLADLMTVCAYHAGNSEVNNRSIGIEVYQGAKAEMYEEQLLTLVRVVDFITAHFGIQRQIPGLYKNRPVPRLDDGGGRDFYGVVGHRDVSDQRGEGDPGNPIMDLLEKKGYERFDLFKSDDLTVWKSRQKMIQDRLHKQMGIDGIPGPGTTAALKELGFMYGLWALPPKNKEVHDQAFSIIDAFFPAVLAATGDVKKALETIESWLKTKQGA